METHQHLKELQKHIEPTKDELALCDAFRLLGDWNRFRIMKALLKAKELCVSDISEVIGISMSGTSQHLRILEMSGLVTSERMGQTICYAPCTEHPQVKEIITLLQ